RDGGVAAEILCIHNGVVETGLRTVVQEHRIEHFPPGTGEAEGDIGDTQDGTAAGQCLLDQAQPFDGLSRRADVVLISRADWKYQGIKNNILWWDMVFLDQQRI